MALAPGQHLGPYEIVDRLGKGGMGEVYRARDARLGRDVAVKVLPESMAGDPNALARFEREARAVAALNHPAIVVLFDVGREGPTAYAVTELLQGNTVRERLDQDGAFYPRVALALAVQFAAGLGASHDAGIVHRDIKPENLFVSSDGRGRILDFGIALHESPEAPSAAATVVSTAPGLVMGTLGYIAPEVIRGEPATPRSDVFAFGLVLYEMLTGDNPFLRDTAAETFTAILREHPAPLSRIRPDVSPALARIVDRCLEKEPANRPGSMRDLALYLDAIDAEALPSANVGGGSETTGAPAPALRRQVLTVVAVASALALGWVHLVGMRNADATLSADLERASRHVVHVERDRLERLRLTAGLVASFPALKAAFESDAATTRDFLTAYQQRQPDTPLLIALGPDGHVFARTDTVGVLPIADDVSWLDTLPQAVEGAVVTIDGRPHHAARALAEAGGTIFGSVVAAAPVDASLAQMLQAATEADIVILDDVGVRGSTIRADMLPWTTASAWRANGNGQNKTATVSIGDRTYVAREVSLSEDPIILVALLKAVASATSPFTSIQIGLIVILLAAASGLAWLLRPRDARVR
jgi:hypothetical protein